MKTYQQIISSDPVIIGDFDNEATVFSYFKAGEDAKDFKVLFASYGSGWESAAFVLLEKDGKLYEVFGSHCSCYGLEGQFDPELIPEDACPEYLMKYEPLSRFDCGATAKEFKKFLGL